METVYRDYAPKGVKFYYIYKALAHPELNTFVTPFTMQERLMHVEEAEQRLGSEIPWLADNMDNEIKHSMGNAPNSEFIIDPEGRVAVRRVWSSPAKLRKDLEELVGPVENPTEVEDLDMPESVAPVTDIATGVLPRVEVPQGTRPLRIEPDLKASEHPFYVKLRAEAQRGVLEGEAGSLYLGFHLDPIYQVHWNNLAGPLEFELRCPQGLVCHPTKATAGKPQEEADKDPREFLAQVRGQSEEPMALTVRYFACDDADTFCVPVTQNYQMHLERDHDGGSVIRRERTADGNTRGDEESRPAGGTMMERMMRRDENGDGRLSKDELPRRMQMMFDVIDADGDGFITKQEMEEMQRTMGGRRGGRGGPPSRPPGPSPPKEQPPAR